ncbi:MAG TPA: EpsI family protein [Bryobacteraceae bacterium]|nr:EpsI family protein [Bryobacteraceae bacterium]
MREFLWLTVPVILATQALVVSYGLSAEHLPALADLAGFPTRVGTWSRIADQPVDPAVRAQLGADRLLERIYQSPKMPSGLDFFVAWFQSQRGGKTQPHSPQVCLPGSGWVVDDIARIHIDTAAGSIPANRYLVTSSLGQRAVVIYWYQTPRRVLAGEWESKFWLIPDAFRDHRTDTALVRIVVWSAAGRENEATVSAVDFARLAYPVLRRLLPS